MSLFGIASLILAYVYHKDAEVKDMVRIPGEEDLMEC
jgi:hypothetical protein